MKIIGIDARFILRPLRGIPLYVLRLYEHLPKLKPEYQFIFFINKAFEHNDKPQKYKQRIRAIEEKSQNIRFVNVNSDGEFFWEQCILPRLVKDYKVNLLHMPANRISFFSGIPTIVTLHDVMEYIYLLDEKYPLSWGKNRSLRYLLYNLRYRFYLKAMYRVFFKRAVQIITVSKNSAADIEKHLKIPRKRISVIYHGVDPEYLSNKPKPRSQRFFTLMLGGDSYQKNPQVAIKAWSLVGEKLRQRFPLKILGFCGSENSPLLEAIQKYGLKNEIDIQPWVDQNVILNAFRNAALFLFPSRYEGFGFPLIQAMACGTPFITTNRASIPEVIGDAGLVYEPNDAVGMSLGIEKILSDTIFWQHQVRLGLQRVQIFKWENSAQKHLEIFESLL